MNLEGIFPFEWRQGMKHDLSRVMVLKKINTTQFENGFQQLINLEEALVFGFLNGSKHPR